MSAAASGGCSTVVVSSSECGITVMEAGSAVPGPANVYTGKQVLWVYENCRVACTCDKRTPERMTRSPGAAARLN